MTAAYLTTGILAIWLLGPGVAFAQQSAPDTAQIRGTETNLPLPRFVSLKASETNVRRGPSLTFRIDWVFKQKDLPVEIVAEYGQWRQVRDPDGAGGWVHYSLLSGARSVLVTEDLAALRARPDEDAQVNAYAEFGVIARLGECLPQWCWISGEGGKGWTRKADIWGVSADELRE